MTIFREPVHNVQAMRDNPAQFCKGIAGVKILPWQEEFLRWLERREAVTIALPVFAGKGEKP